MCVLTEVVLHGLRLCAFECLQEDLERVRIAGQGRVDITVGSALDIFGGKLKYDDVVAWHKKQQKEQRSAAKV